MFENSPVKSNLLRNATWILPENYSKWSWQEHVFCYFGDASSCKIDINNNNNNSNKKFSKTQFQRFLFNDVKENKENFLSVNKNQKRLDVFLYDYVGKVVEYNQIRKLIQFILTMSHSQADVERGFSVNEELLVENMQKRTINFRKNYLWPHEE